ncbi:unnamed protein product [Tuber melanosporum]|jgi:pheromone alpha factor receptor|uniref:(Perigord truffle) hypothetical protein n=1 Tax=Tuber melanosporum (strain Mel28) TaxID=656061 RepID=D5GJK5_TUBMM|nr:uncharacterized protein GSTUM_00009053001 [Tuber melanosporum]CAZ84698.1 unnamed protein product [Tuber melanosporum]
MEQIPVYERPGFNPHKQNITLFKHDGSTVTVGLHELDAMFTHSIRVAVVFASQIGACALLSVIVAMVTKREKRRALFFLHIISLLLVVVRSVLQILYFVGPWAETYNYVAYYYEDIPLSDKLISIWAGIIQLILNICILLSLILQVRVVYATSPKLNTIMTLVSCVIASISVGFFFTVIVQISEAILNGVGYDGWVYKVHRGVFAGAIAFFSFIFIFKLAFAIRRRKALGLQRFGPLQVIFIMGCQTMIVPAIFATLENGVGFEGMSSLTATLAVISLPLSSMWAAAQTDGPSPQSTPRDGYRRFSTRRSALNRSDPSGGRSVDMNTLDSTGNDSLALHVDKTFTVESSPSSQSQAGPHKERGFEFA